MRVGPPPTPEQIREEFEEAVQYCLKGQLLPSCVPFNHETTKALEQLALNPRGPKTALIAAARAALDRQLAGT